MSFYPDELEEFVLGALVPVPDDVWSSASLAAVEFPLDEASELDALLPGEGDLQDASASDGDVWPQDGDGIAADHPEPVGGDSETAGESVDHASEHDGHHDFDSFDADGQ